MANKYETSDVRGWQINFKMIYRIGIPGFSNNNQLTIMTNISVDSEQNIDI